MKRAQTQHEPWFRTEEEWQAGLRERYRPKMLKALAVFDEMPRRPDEGAWRAELLEELLGER